MIFEGRLEVRSDIGEQQSVLWSLWTGDAWEYGAEIKFESVGEFWIGCTWFPEKTLCFEVVLGELDLLLTSAGEPHVLERFGIDWEDSAGCPVFWRHIRDSGSVGEWHGFKARSEEFDEFTDDSLGSEHLGDGKNEVGCGGAFAELAREFEPDYVGDEHGDGLAKHRCFRFNSADAPAKDAETVDHGGVAVGAYESVWIGDSFGINEGDSGKVFQIDLVDDACVRWNNPEIGEGFLAPFEELVSFVVSFEFEVAVDEEGGIASVGIDLHAVVDDEFNRLERVDFLGITAEFCHSISHRGEVHYAGDAGEVLENHSGRSE